MDQSSHDWCHLQGANPTDEDEFVFDFRVLHANGVNVHIERESDHEVWMAIYHPDMPHTRQMVRITAEGTGAKLVQTTQPEQGPENV